jgi:hypothetical protein
LQKASLLAAYTTVHLLRILFELNKTTPSLH